MAEVKFTRTQEKQYTGWVTYPTIGTHIAPGRATVTTKEAPWVLATPDGVRALSATELANGYLFKADKGTEPINGQTANSKVVNGVIPWIQVVRNTAIVPSVMARHLPGKSNGGLGQFELYPEQFGAQYTTRIPGNVFVRMFNLQGGLRNIATPEQASAITLKPSTELALVKATKSKVATLNDLKPILKAQLEAVAKSIGIVVNPKFAPVSISDITEATYATDDKYIRGDLEVTFTFSPTKKGTLCVPVAVMDKDKSKAVYTVFPKGESYGVPSSGKKKIALDGLAKPLAAIILDTALAMRDSKVSVSADTQAQIEPIVKTACEALKDKVAPMNYTVTDGIFEIVTADGSMGTVTCIVKQGAPYSCSFVVRELKDNCPAAKAVKAGLIQDNDKVANLKSLASAIVTGFGRIKRQGITPVTAPSTENKYEYRLIGKGKSPDTGEVLYVLERISSGAKTTMNRPQLIRLLEEKRVENAWVRWYKDDRQIRLRSKGGLADMDVSGLRRSSLNRTEGAQNETTVIYSEVIKHLAKKGFTPEGELEVSEEPPVFGTFSVKSEGGSVITAMFSPTEWKYGATDGGKVNLKGTVPEDKRRRSMLASSLVSLILTAAKGAVVSAVNPDAPIIPATDDDFSDPDVFTGVYDEADDIPDAKDAFADLADAEETPVVAVESPDTPEVVDAFAGLEEAPDAADAFAGLEDANTPDSSVTSAIPTPVVTEADPRIEQLSAVVESLIIASAAINTRVENTLVKSNLTSAECIQAGNDVMEFKKAFDTSVGELNALVAPEAGPYLTEFDDPIATAVDRNKLIEDALNKLGAKLKHVQLFEEAQEKAKQFDEDEARRKAEEQVEADRIVAEEAEVEVQRQAQAEANLRAAQAEEDALRQAAEDESQRLAEEETEDVPVEEDPFAGLGDDIDTIFRNLPGEIVSEGK